MPSWSFTVNSTNDMDEIPPELSLSNMAMQHDEFPRDMQLALNLARLLHLPSFTCTGMRAESPYETGNELVDISVRGMVSGDMFITDMKAIIRTGPDEA